MTRAVGAWIVGVYRLGTSEPTRSQGGPSRDTIP